ncbi:MAG TPA: DUF1778 domain-containing protein [Polyangia bacterium]|jgi:uncharacterized protein (DUF1778 family)|nr:DUF1778 domain-containing protein [Polyangia bacterium]
MRPKKQKAERKDQVVQVRVTDEQKKLLETAADAAGADLSTWIRMVALEKARTKT